MDVNLVLFKKNGSQKSFALPSSITTIGRRHDCDLVTADVSGIVCDSTSQVSAAVSLAWIVNEGERMKRSPSFFSCCRPSSGRTGS